MARRNHLPPGGRLELRDGVVTQPVLIPQPQGPPRLVHLIHQLPLPSTSSSSSSARVDDRIALNHREIQSLLDENQRLAATHTLLKQDLAHSQLELHELTSAAARLKAERDNHVREVYERSLKMDAELRSVDVMGADLARVRIDVQKLSATKLELLDELKKIEADIISARLELDKLPAVKADIDSVLQELQRGRAAIECEKKTRASNNVHRQEMEKTKVIISCEIEKLRIDLAHAEKRAMAAAASTALETPTAPAPAYATSYVNPVMDYGGRPYPYVYDVHQVSVATNAVPHHGSGMGAYGPYDMQQPNVHR